MLASHFFFAYNIFLTKAENMQTSLGSIELTTQWDKLHHVAFLVPSADAVAALALESVSLDIVSVTLFKGKTEVARCGFGELLAWNRPEASSWRLPFIKPNRVLPLKDRYSIVVQTSEPWDAPGRILLTYVYCGFPISSKTQINTELPWKEMQPQAWQPKPLPPVEPVQEPIAQLCCTTMELELERGLWISLRNKFLVERIQVPPNLPPFVLVLDGHPTLPSQGGVIVVNSLCAYAGTLPLPYSGPWSLARGPRFVQEDRALNLATVDGQGPWLRFRESVSEATIEVTFYWWRL